MCNIEKYLNYEKLQIFWVTKVLMRPHNLWEILSFQNQTTKTAKSLSSGERVFEPRSQEKLLWSCNIQNWYIVAETETLNEASIADNHSLVLSTKLLKVQINRLPFRFIFDIEKSFLSQPWRNLSLLMRHYWGQCDSHLFALKKCKHAWFKHASCNI